MRFEFKIIRQVLSQEISTVAVIAEDEAEALEKVVQDDLISHFLDSDEPISAEIVSTKLLGS